MKRFISLSLVFLCLLSLAGCGSTDLAELSKPAFENLNNAYEIIDDFGNDVYEGWRIAIYDSSELSSGGSKYLAKELHLTDQELELGIAYTQCKLEGVTWDDSNKDLYLEKYVGNAFKTGRYSWDTVDHSYQDYRVELFSFTIWCIANAYELSGKTAEAVGAIESAEEVLHVLASEHYDYYHYSDLKNYYVAVCSYLEYCKSPSGSFEQSVTTINEYRNDIRACSTALNLLYNIDPESTDGTDH